MNAARKFNKPKFPKAYAADIKNVVTDDIKKGDFSKQKQMAVAAVVIGITIITADFFQRKMSQMVK